jgi:hypothetical protein
MQSDERKNIYSDNFPKLILEGGDFNYVIFSDKETEKFVQFYANKGAKGIHVDIPYLAIEEDETGRLLQLHEIKFKKENDSYVSSFTIEEAIDFVDILFLNVFLLPEDFRLEIELVLDN